MGKILNLCRRWVEEYRESTVMEMAHCPGEGWEVNPGHTRTEGLNSCCFYFSVQGLFKEFTGIQPWQLLQDPHKIIFRFCHLFLAIPCFSLSRLHEHKEKCQELPGPGQWSFPSLGRRSARVEGRQHPPRWPLLHCCYPDVQIWGYFL